jgi:hypothetical protein
LKEYVSLQAHRDSRLIASLPAGLFKVSWRVCFPFEDIVIIRFNYTFQL